MSRIPIQNVNRNTDVNEIPGRLYIDMDGYVCDKETKKPAKLDLTPGQEVIVIKREDFVRMFKVYSLRSLTLH